MSDDRLHTHLLVTAHVRACHAAGIPVYVARRGDERGGQLILKINLIEAGCRVLTQAVGRDGRSGWLAAFEGRSVPEAEADAYIAREAKRDPDLWVIEIEDRAGRVPLGVTMV